ncbi:exonuclease SbcCD subunit D [Lactobacillus sp. DCY120]|uniref:Nuclease SbcCD subunit D n=1 Tax=Bombilactobacillus apium TaxID=2675299 RepID=A0A850R699_9LACO|nr:exonuclease SbcCD subunit D [Bombilactobacillus apium]NVY96357.1 exonuclease SbcCD subunit D [Bombilactobacillus apium]
MKLLHTADWHIGRTLNGYSLLAEQKAVFAQIVQIAQDEEVDGIVIAGDLYDRAIPSPEAVTTLDQMFRTLNLEKKIPIYAISGNHDSARRLNYGRKWLEETNFYLHTLLEEAFTPIETPTLQIFLLPFFDPLDARVYYQKKDLPAEDVAQIKTIADALELVIADLVELFDPTKKHLLVTHFAVTAHQEDSLDLTSETTSQVGGLATVTTKQFAAFDYVMLGHIHTRHASPAPTVRYAGSPVKFNVKEARAKNNQKSVEIVDFTAQKIQQKVCKLIPQTDLVVLEADWETLCDPSFYQQQPVGQAWFAITIQNFERSAHLQTNLRSELEKRYGTIVELDYQTNSTSTFAPQESTDLREISPEKIVNNFFQTITAYELSPAQKDLVAKIFNEVEREQK